MSRHVTSLWGRCLAALALVMACVSAPMAYAQQGVPGKETNGQVTHEQGKPDQGRGNHSSSGGGIGISVDVTGLVQQALSHKDKKKDKSTTNSNGAASKGSPQQTQSQQQFAMNKYVCPWTNAPAAPVPVATCNSLGNSLTQVLPGQAIYYQVVIHGPGNIGDPTWNVTLDETPGVGTGYPAGFAGNVQNVTCYDYLGNIVFTGSPATNPILGTIPVQAGRDVTCVMAGYFTSNPSAMSNANNTVNLTEPGGGTGSKSVNATVQTTATLPTNISVVKTATPATIADGGIATYTITISNQAGPTGQPVYLGGFLQLYDQIALVPTSSWLTATLQPGTTCTSTGGADCLDTTPFYVNSPQTVSSTASLPLGWWPTLAKWHFTNAGFMPAGSSITLTYHVKIDHGATCGPTTGNGLENVAWFDLLGQAGLSVSDSNPADNTTPNQEVDVNISQQPCPSAPSLTVTKTVHNPSQQPPNIVPWGTPVQYDYVVSNSSGQTITGINLNDYFYDYNTSATVTGAVTTLPASPVGTATGTQTLNANFMAANLWGGNIGTLANGSQATFSMSMTYNTPSCSVSGTETPIIENYLNVGFSYAAGSSSANSNVAEVDMASPPKCQLKVTKAYVGPAPSTIAFGTSYQYAVTFENTSAAAMTVYTVADFLNVDLPGYATPLSVAYKYNCTDTGGVTGYSTWAQNPSAPGTNSTTVTYHAASTQGTQILGMNGQPVNFPSGAKLTCMVTVQVAQPAPGNPNCMNQQDMAKLENIGVIYPNAYPYYNSGPPQDPDMSQQVETPLPRCFNLTVNKDADQSTTTTSGPTLTYTINVKNEGPNIGPLANPNWLVLNDVFSNGYIQGAPTISAINPAVASACGPAPSDLCEIISLPGQPLKLGIKNLAADQTLVIQYPLAPPFNTTKIHNKVTVTPQGSLATDWYPNSTDTLTSFKDVPVTDYNGPETGDGQICVQKFNDLDGNGQHDPGEPWLASWQFTIHKLPSGPDVTGTTDQQGQYCSNNDLLAGNYTVTETMQSGWTNSLPGGATPQIPVTLADGDIKTVLFGNFQSGGTPDHDDAQICIQKFNDLNGNGVHDANEPWLPGWSFTIHQEPNGPDIHGTTDDKGVYCTDKALAAGLYTITETMQSGWTNTLPGGQTPSIEINLYESTTQTVLFGNHQAQDTGILKICKVAGDGVEIGTPFDFDVTSGGNSSTVGGVPAGPAPGGYCQIAGSYPIGSQVQVDEAAQDGFQVTGIGFSNPSAEVPSLTHVDQGQAGVTIQPGVTEVTFTNIGTTGYIEICKAGDVKGDFTFTVEGQDHTVPAGACTPAIKVKAGKVVIHEHPTAGTAMAGCAIYPSGRSIACNPAGWTATAEAKGGGLPNETIVTITNKRATATDTGTPNGGGKVTAATATVARPAPAKPATAPQH